MRVNEGMSDAQFQKMFTYMQQMHKDFQNSQAELRRELKQDINRVYNLIDAETKRHETDEQERSFLNHTVDNHETRITKLEEKTAL